MVFRQPAAKFLCVEEPGRSMSAANAHAPAAVPPDGNDTDDDDRICRYCLADASEGELISPCACKGGQRWVHTECLVSWQRSVLVTQPTHPAFYEDDVRQTICSVCRTPFNRPPPSRAELMASFTGPQLASLLAPGSLIVCERDTSAAMLRTIALSEHLGRCARMRFLPGVASRGNCDRGRGFLRAGPH